MQDKKHCISQQVIIGKTKTTGEMTEVTINYTHPIFRKDENADMDKFWNSPKTLPTKEGNYLTAREYNFNSAGSEIVYEVEMFSKDSNTFESDELDMWHGNMALMAWAHIPKFKEQE